MAIANVPVSLEQLYRSDGDRLWRALYAYTRDQDTASDAVSEAFAQALRRGTGVRNPQAWVWKTAFRLAGAEMQRRSRQASIPLPESSYRDHIADDALLDALQRLPPPQRAAVILFYFADLPIREIAARTGRPSVTVRVHLSRGRKRLRVLLGDETDA